MTAAAGLRHLDERLAGGRPLRSGSPANVDQASEARPSSAAEATRGEDRGAPCLVVSPSRSVQKAERNPREDVRSPS